MRSILAALAAAAALAPSGANAGFTIGGRLGLAFPGGNTAGDSKLSDSVDWAVPFQLDVGGRGQHLAFAGYLRLAPGKLDLGLKNDCESRGATCSVLDLGVGFQASYHFSTARAGPWVGGFVGWERLRYDLSVGADTGTLTATGWEYGVQGGLDFAWGVFTLGPFGEIALGRFTELASYDPRSGTTDTHAISDERTHAWFIVGVKTAFVF
jgi:hypothetical protein